MILKTGRPYHIFCTFRPNCKILRRELKHKIRSSQKAQSIFYQMQVIYTFIIYGPQISQKCDGNRFPQGYICVNTERKKNIP